MSLFRYHNPVWPGYLADPFVMRAGKWYYAVGTGGAQPDGRMFPMLRSPDLANWEHLGGALEIPDALRGASFWAPEIAGEDSRFYLYYSAGGPQGESHQIRAAVSESPQGPFTDTGRPLMPDEPFSIDPHPFRDPRDGRWYLFFAKDYRDATRPGTGLAAAELSPDMTSISAAPVEIMTPAWDWHLFQRNRRWYDRDWDRWHTVEGPFVISREGRYYCFYSGGRWESADYGVSVAVAESVLGPYRNDQAESGPDVLRGIEGRVLGPGHNSITKAPDGVTDMMVYHAWDPGFTARRMFIDPLVWTEEGPRCDGPTLGPREIDLARLSQRSET